MKRKTLKDGTEAITVKRARTEQSSTIVAQPSVDLLRQYYHNVTSLRDYLVQHIPRSSKRRKRLLIKHGRELSAEDCEPAHQAELDLLDTTLVGWHRQLEVDIHVDSDRSAERNHVLSQHYTQEEVLAHCFTTLVQRSARLARGKHVLFNEATSRAGSATDTTLQKLAQHPWTILPKLVGHQYCYILIDMFLECGIFQCVTSSSSNLVQTSGPAINDLPILTQLSNETIETSERPSIRSHELSVPRIRPSGYTSISIERHCMFYAMPTVSKRGKTCADHVLNRGDAHTKSDLSIDLLARIFPSQCKHGKAVHNVDRQRRPQCVEKLKSAGISHAILTLEKVPKRLRGRILDTIKKIERRHKQTSYHMLLQHYCSASPTDETKSAIALATPDSRVSAFACAVIRKVFGKACFGGLGNWQKLASKVDHFVRLRRHEHMNMHEILNGIAISDIPWLVPTGMKQGQKISRTDFEKRKRLMADFLRFLFEDFLISLLRNSFYVTEASSHRNRLFYYRHDVWRALTAPFLRTMKATKLEHCAGPDLKAMINRTSLGISRVRLVPKESGMRPIVNLGKKILRQPNGTVRFGRSINHILAPAFHALTYEKVSHPTALESAMLSAEEMFPKLEAFRQRLIDDGIYGQDLYFGRLDIKSCFDSLPHDKLLEVAREMLSEDSYSIAKFGIGRLLAVSKANSSLKQRPVWKYAYKATRADRSLDIKDEAAKADARNHAVFVDLAVQRQHDRKALLKLLREHVEEHFLRVEGQIYRQREGIAQGSIVSSILCSLLYTRVEREVLGIIDNRKTMLVRLIDDFMLISTSRGVVERFMLAMHAGLPAYGVEVKLKKSLTNFGLVIGDFPIPTLPAVADFPYCGYTVHTRSLDLGRDVQQKGKLIDSMTVQYGRATGQAFRQRILQAMRLQMRRMLLSTAYNSPSTVKRNLQHICQDIAERTYCYLRSLPNVQQSANSLIIGLIQELIRLAQRTFHKSQAQRVSEPSVRSTDIDCIVSKAFSKTLQRRQTQYKTTLSWLSHTYAQALPLD